MGERDMLTSARQGVVICRLIVTPLIRLSGYKVSSTE